MIKTVNYKEYICDCCKEKSREQDFLHEIKIPAKDIPYVGAIHVAKFEVCLNCLRKIYNTLEQKFEIVDEEWGENLIKER